MAFVHIIGFGGQSKAIAPSLKEAGFESAVYLKTGSASFAKCSDAGISARELSSLRSNLNDGDLVIFGCPDRVIGDVYHTLLASTPKTVHFILLHGFAIWSKSIAITENGVGIENAKHTFNLLAPKAIGPELREAIRTARPHGLKAALFSKEAGALKSTLDLATRGLGFTETHLIPATFEQETVGDLISEQLLLCGGVFSLLEWTIQEMKAAGVPDALIHEECITEMGLIVNVLKKRGLQGTVEAISDSAKAGAVMMRERFIEHKLPELLHKQAEEVLNGTFLKNLQNETEWKSKLKEAFHEHSR